MSSIRSFSYVNGNLVTLKSEKLFNILIRFQNVFFKKINGDTSFAWSRAVLHEITLGRQLDLVGRDATAVLPGRKKNVQRNQVEWRHAIAHGQSDRAPLVIATPNLSPASAVTVATPLWPAA